MARRCFFVQKVEPGAEIVNLSAEVSRHLESVLRLKAGETVEIRDGLGHAWTGEIARIHKGSAAVRLVGPLDASFLESPLDVTLALGFTRSDIMDLVVRQATEMGVARMAAFRAARSQYALAGVRAGKMVGRWLKIAAGRLQCGWTECPKSRSSRTWTVLSVLFRPVPRAGAGSCNLALEGERNRGLDRVKAERASVLRDPGRNRTQGGWDDSEMLRLIGAGFHPIHLGPRILRFETRLSH